MPELTLFYTPTCPFCRRVLQFMEQNGITCPMKDISADPASQEELISIGGKGQVPCLVMNGQALYESEDIIAWFKDNREVK